MKLRQASLLLVGLLLVTTAKPALAIDAYVVAGQSNGWRISHLRQARGAKADDSQPKVYYFGMPCVSEPSSSKLATLTTLDKNTMGYGLAGALADRAGEDIVFIQYCRCGASVLNRAKNGWWPGEDPTGGKTFDDGLFSLFQRYIESARVQVKEQLNEELEFKGLFWHQGESDSGADKAKFERALKNLFVRFRGELDGDLPIVVGHIRDLGVGPQGVNATLDRIAKQDSRIVTVPIDGLAFEPDRNGKPDVHIALPGCHELGRRMAEALESKTLETTNGTKDSSKQTP